MTPSAQPVRIPDQSVFSSIDQLVDVEQHLAAQGLAILDLLSSVSNDPTDASREVWDPASHALWFFHRHPGEPRFAGEVGHFHTFLGAAGMPRGTEPFVLPEMAMPTAAAAGLRPDPVTHLSSRYRGRFGHIIGISVNAASQPVGLFTTNRWVTGEIWYRATDAGGMIDRFHLDPTMPCVDDFFSNVAPVSLWLTGVLALLRPHIVELLRQRDENVMDWRRRRSRQHHVFDDRRLEIPSLMEVDFALELEQFRGCAA